jgi:hypothetical protein
MESNQAELLKVISSLFAKYKIPYMITGAWSVIYYGRPRASHDIDYVVELGKKDIPRVIRALQSLSPDFSFDKDAMREAIEKRHMFQILHLPTVLKFNIWLLKENDSFDVSRFKRRKTMKILEQNMVLASAEDTILQKLRWYKDAEIEKHIVDAAFVYQIQKRNLDIKYLQLWAKQLSLTKFLIQLEEIDLEKYL